MNGRLPYALLWLGLCLTAAAEAPRWELVWSDEFNDPAINSKNWTYDTGGGGWGNNELEYYTKRPENSSISHDRSGNGFLVIEARKEHFGNRSFTSARLKTQGLHSWTYGRIEARINLPAGSGVWPAFWMLGANIPQVGWPKCGEIDILEHVPSLGPDTVRGSLHAPGFSAGDSLHGDGSVPDLLGQFHIFAVEWEPNQVRWYLDGKNYYTANSRAARGRWVFDHPFFIILNLAIGGNWPGPPDATTPFPVRMLVDYVRVYRDANLASSNP
jgi:beta-glucanase (GH16 family)